MRVVGPPVVLLLVWLASLALVDRGSRAVATVAMIPFAAGLVTGAAAVYPAMRRRGASVAAATAGGLLVPALWVAKECWAMSRLYTAGEAAYYAFNPLALGLVAAAAVQMATAELAMRRLRSGRWTFRNGAAAVLAAVAAVGIVVAVASRHGGPTTVFWAYVAGHRRLFGDVP